MSKEPRCEKCASWVIGCGCVHSIAGKIWQPGINLAPICRPYTPMPAPEPSAFDRALAGFEEWLQIESYYKDPLETEKVALRFGWNARGEADLSIVDNDYWVHRRDLRDAIRKLEEME